MDKNIDRGNKQTQENEIPKGKKSLLDPRADEYIKESGKIEDYPDEKKK